ncbi:hypothetical protein SUGI_0585860 [Cryptomeria japonica]|uniref:zinc finger CCCH domain-containing protein 2 n=1 Tax=Cryptomeria japonica TaxID=3369 RepID=UPI00241474A3|nr:zinc finger CCCH domain-containing protein 2 [Cryptomeria japonica]GLJ29705.1 hypothetical protein SUGI_0585860 [Cryptomeria japonica]
MGSLGWSFFSDESASSISENGGFGMGDGNYCSEGPVFESCGIDFSSSLNGLVQGSCSSPRLEDLIGALQKYLPSNNEDEEGSLPSADAYACDEFRMYEFKVRRCMRGRSHDWTECPFAHPGEKARRRDPRRFHYSGTACPDFRKGSCRRGDTCEFAHGVFECWLHPARYRTQPCKDGRNCKRRVCFFAHTPEQLRLLPSISSPQATGGASRSALALALHASAVKNSLSASYDGSPRRQLLDGLVDSSNHAGDSGSHYFSKAVLSSPTSTLVGHSESPPPLSPPLSPSVSPPESPNAWLNSVNSLNSVSFNSRALKGFQKPVLSPSALAQVQPSPGTVSFVQGSSTRRHHLDRVASMPAITLPSSGTRHAVLSGPSSPVAQSTKSMVELINSLQNLELNSWQPTQMPGNGCHGSPRGSNLRHCVSSSVSCTPKSNHNDLLADFRSSYSENVNELVQGYADNLVEVKSTYGDNMAVPYEEPVQRVESGRDLRAKIYGKLNKQNHQEHLPAEASPDLGWVNELVK